MCIVVDPPLFIALFKDTDPDHGQFAPVLLWVTKGPGKFVLGGSTYNRELMNVKSILPSLVELERQRKLVRASQANVDIDEAVIKGIERCADFDDPHLVALIRVTGCKLVCVRDGRSHRFLRDTRFYHGIGARPSLYTREKNKHLLRVDKVAPCCR